MRKCEICKRGSVRSNIRTHSNKAIPRKQHLNLQWVTDAGKRMIACTTCRKTLIKKSA